MAEGNVLKEGEECPACGSSGVKRVTASVKAKRAGVEHIIDVPDVLECNQCEERYLTPEQARYISGILKSQGWFWSKKWQEGEREAEEDILTGRLHYFDSTEEAIAALDASDEERIE